MLVKLYSLTNYLENDIVLTRARRHSLLGSATEEGGLNSHVLD